MAKQRDPAKILKKNEAEIKKRQDTLAANYMSAMNEATNTLRKNGLVDYTALDKQPSQNKFVDAYKNDLLGNTKAIFDIKQMTNADFETSWFLTAINGPLSNPESLKTKLNKNFTSPDYLMGGLLNPKNINAAVSNFVGYRVNKLKPADIPTLLSSVNAQQYLDTQKINLDDENLFKVASYTGAVHMGAEQGPDLIKNTGLEYAVNTNYAPFMNQNKP